MSPSINWTDSSGVRHTMVFAPSWEDKDIDLGNAETELVPIEYCDNVEMIETKDLTHISLRTSTIPVNKPEIDGIHMTGYLSHVRRSRQDSGKEWQSIEAFDLRSIGDNKYVRIPLGPNNLKALFVTLLRQYKSLGSLQHLLSEQGVVAVGPELTKALEGRESEVLRLLLSRGEGFIDGILEHDQASILEAIAVHREHNRRCDALAEFDKHMQDKDWDERDWQAFFESNDWIFGYGLSYRFLPPIQAQADLGGGDISKKGADLTDFLLGSDGKVRFTVVVDIKRPDSNLMVAKEYRTNIFRPAKELTGGVSQLQSYTHHWQTIGSQSIYNRPEKIGAFTYNPKGILVIGHTEELVTDHHVKSFELFRRGLQSPEIVTFDELYARAQHIVKISEPSEAECEDPVADHEDIPDF